MGGFLVEYLLLVFVFFEFRKCGKFFFDEKRVRIFLGLKVLWFKEGSWFFGFFMNSMVVIYIFFDVGVLFFVVFLFVGFWGGVLFYFYG